MKACMFCFSSCTVLSSSLLFEANRVLGTLRNDRPWHHAHVLKSKVLTCYRKGQAN